MPDLSREQAQLIVAEMRVRNGGLSDEIRAKTPRDALEVIESLRHSLGAATKTLATNLYSKDTRFVFEFIQNAEDNSYKHARREGKPPCITFHVYADRIVIDSNEDGFKEENVRAICSTAESTKSKVKGYIGEKGIGFKSVFKVAKKVRIQSGPFSFSFKYIRSSNDSGLGMVTPFDEPYEENLPTTIRTRMTLDLLDETLSASQRDELFGIPDTLLLFLEKLGEIAVKTYVGNTLDEEIRFSHPRDHTSSFDIQTLTKYHLEGGSRSRKEEITKNQYYVFRRSVQNLPADDARKSNEIFIRTATVVLAFPIDEKFQPVIQPQLVFAFLPLRRVGFTFVIQSDFITQASREDVVHSAWNGQLLHEVAEAFRQAALKFTLHPSLKYTWLHYFPTGALADDWWDQLRLSINSKLVSASIAESATSTLHRPNHLREIPYDYLDNKGAPLVPDINPERYLSRAYGKTAIIAFKQLGLVPLSSNEFLDRVEADLASRGSIFKSPNTSDEWHKRMFEALSKLYNTNEFGYHNPHGFGVQQRVRRLSVIPLQDGRWVSACGTVYFSKTDSIPIPSDLGLNLMEEKVEEHPSRKPLFLLLGVTNCDPSVVKDLIYQRYRKHEVKLIKDSVAHLKYLYWNFSPEEVEIDQKVWISNDDYQAVYPHQTPKKIIYFDDPDEEYGPAQLLRPSGVEAESDSSLKISFLFNLWYLDAVPADERVHGISWVEWLEKVMGVQKVPQLLDLSGHELSSEFLHIIRNRSEKLLGTLKKHWKVYEVELKFVRVKLQSQLVRSRCYFNFLNDTYLPIPKLEDEVAKWKVEEFPFICMDKKIAQEDVDEWSFVSRLGVAKWKSLRFYLDLVKRIPKYHTAQAKPTFEIEDLVEIYSKIQSKCSNDSDKDLVRKYFMNNGTIFVPSRVSNGVLLKAFWNNSSECVWEGPEWLTVKNVLVVHLSYEVLRVLFRDVLKIADASWRDAIEELEYRKEKKATNVTTLKPIYVFLRMNFGRDTDFGQLRNTFEEKELIYIASTKTWIAPSSCVWAEDTVWIPGKMSLATEYAEQEDFFVRILGVQTPNVEMHVQALIEKSGKLTVHPSELKEMIFTISSMKPQKNDLEKLRTRGILPVKYANGLPGRAHMSADFAIPDRPQYNEAFQGKIITLDFSIGEIRAAMPFLAAAGLEGRLLSTMVQEETAVEGGKLNTQLTQSFVEKSYAIFRIAAHYGCPKIKGSEINLYERFSAAKIFVSNGISKNMMLSQYDGFITVKSEKGNFHLEEMDGELRLYVPRRTRDREECYLQQLPKRLLSYLAISDPKALSIMISILQAPRLSVVDAILRNEGIVEIEGISHPEEPDSDTETVSETVTEREKEPEPARESENGISTSSSLTPRSSPISTPFSSTSPSPSRRGYSIRSSQTPQIRVFDESAAPEPERQPSAEAVREQSEYAILLDHAIVAASNTALPKFLNQRFYEVNENRIFEFHRQRSFDRDKKIGAAGELFVFELLKNLGLPGFSLQNWQSTIRSEVSCHAKYSNITHWGGSETADIVYHDVESNLTTLLIAHDYLDRGTWANATPRYFIEVKTTTGDCGDRFFMSGAQYNRMQRMHLEESQQSDGIYMVFRVSDLVQGKIGLKIYLDPEEHRTKERLSFNVDTWAVTPKC